MAYILTCPRCATKLPLFRSAIEKRKGVVRCLHCGSRISYDLNASKIQKSGFQKTIAPPFNTRTKDKLLAALSGKIKAYSLRSNNQILSMENPFTQKTDFVSLTDALGTLNRKEKK
jgi:hypothetical protein